MEMMGKIQRMYFRDNLSLHEIFKRTELAQLSAKTAFIRLGIRFGFWSSI
jgi:hypothetical protein